MQSTNQPNKNDNSKPESPKMTKPVTGEFEKNRKKLGPMVKSQKNQAKGK